jgi:hypothetical protein
MTTNDRRAVAPSPTDVGGRQCVAAELLELLRCVCLPFKPASNPPVWFARCPQITGCSSGLGRALAIDLHGRSGAEGKQGGAFRVFASARNTNALSDLAAMGIDVVQLDVTSQVSHVTEQAVTALRPRCLSITAAVMLVHMCVLSCRLQLTLPSKPSFNRLEASMC